MWVCVWESQFHKNRLSSKKLILQPTARIEIDQNSEPLLLTGANLVYIINNIKPLYEKSYCIRSKAILFRSKKI